MDKPMTKCLKRFYRKCKPDLEEILTCKICHKRFKHLGSHVALTHKILARQYKRRFGFDVTTPLVEPYISDKHRQDAYKYGMGDRIKRLGKATRYVKGDKRAGAYRRSKQTKERLLGSAALMKEVTWSVPAVRRKWKINMSKARTGRKHRPSSIKKMSEARRRWWMRRRFR
ncbi:MAG: MucR family transcriptional regulator [Gallionella sp.]|jgi:hypothetical protein